MAGLTMINEGARGIGVVHTMDFGGPLSVLLLLGSTPRV
jgi:hypothetical protein